MTCKMLNFLDLLDLEQFIPVMSASELSKYEQAVIGIKASLFSFDQIDRWEHLMLVRNVDIQNRFNSAILKSQN